MADLAIGQGGGLPPPAPLLGLKWRPLKTPSMNTKKVSLEQKKRLLNTKLLIKTKLLAKYRISNDETVISGLNLASELSATIDKEVKSAQLFYLIIDSTINISRIDQMSVSLR